MRGDADAIRHFVSAAPASSGHGMYSRPMTTFEGKCSCGDVHFTLQSKPLFVHCCHCFDCQRQTGSAFVINALIETDRISRTGTPEPVSMPTDSGRPHEIYRCTTCKTAVWSDYGRRPKL